jgi:hypothetical protein
LLSSNHAAAQEEAVEDADRKSKNRIIYFK